MYSTGLGDLERIQLPPPPGSESNHFDIFQNYEMQADSRNELQTHLRSRGIGTIVQWAGKAVHQFPELELGSHNIPNVEAFFKRCLLLPMNTSLTNEEVEYICEQIRLFYSGDWTP